MRRAVAGAVHDYIASRMAELGLTIDGVRRDTDLFEARILDSLSIAALVAAVERATGCAIDFMQVDPDELATIDGIVDALTRAVENGFPPSRE